MQAVEQRRVRQAVRARKAYNFARGATLWVPQSRKIECFGSGTCGAWATRSASAGPRDTPLNLDGSANLESWHTPDRGVTLGTDLVAIGIAAPAPCTISADTGGTLTTSIAPYISIAASGTRGTATFNYSIEGPGGAAFNPTPIATGADVAMPGTGLKVQFSLGTYTTGTHFYQASVASWLDQTPLARLLSAPSGATARPVIVARARNNRPTISSDGNNAKHLKDVTSNWADNLGTGTAKSRSVYMVCRTASATPSSTNCWFALNSTADADTGWKLCVKNATNDYSSIATDDAGGTADITHGGALDTNYHLLSWILNGTTMSLYDNGTLVYTDTQSVGAQTFDTAIIFADAFGSGAAGGHALNGEIGEWMSYSAAHSTTTRNILEAYLRAGWGF